MKRNYTIIPLALLLLIAMVACSNKSKGNTDSEGKQPKSTVSVPQFDADSAYRYVKEQVDFGPRVPNTAAHKACGEYLAKKLILRSTLDVNVTHDHSRWNRLDKVHEKGFD